MIAGTPDAWFRSIFWVITWKCEAKLRYCCKGIWSETVISDFEVDSYTIHWSHLWPEDPEDQDPANKYINPRYLDLDGSDIQKDLNDLSDGVHDTAYNKVADKYKKEKDSVNSKGCLAAPIKEGIRCKGKYVLYGVPVELTGETHVHLTGGDLNPPTGPQI
jgi:hypothetical protein